ncbi:hypothetical protein JCM19232_1502 [Vibrio ishigakensis]|uniref:Uncharacterized protein n=1 Tax=Vibrio ishigakensis TaxID=1481914 RepID=A0A0B8P963_9VIBR|nr:hypothetical protein JCM19232_1502 [Vibrio ishigakensis]
MTYFFLISIYLLLINVLLKNRNWVVIFIFLLPLIFFSAYRDIGADTDTYKFIYYSFSFEGYSFSVFGEPLFYGLIYLSREIFLLDHIEFFGVNATIICLFYSVALSRYDRAGFYIATVGPVFLMNAITNGMRIGLAYHIVLLGYVYRKEIKYSLIAGLAHITSPLIVLYDKYINEILVNINIKKFIYLILIGVLSVISFEMLLSFEPRIKDKIDAYSNFLSPGILSGVSDIYVIFVVLILKIVHDRKNTGSSYILNILLILLFCFSLKLATFYSYAFLRVIKLLLVGVVLSNLNLIKLNNYRSTFLFILLPYYTNYFFSVINAGA